MEREPGAAYWTVREALELAFRRGDIVMREGGEESPECILSCTLDELSDALEQMRREVRGDLAQGRVVSDHALG